MKMRKFLLSAATAAAVFTSAWLGASPGLAQTTAPEPTPIPLDASDAAVPPAAARPQAEGGVSWWPNGEFLRPDAGRNVMVTAASGDGLDFDYARVTFYNSIDQPVNSFSATVAATSSVSGIDVMTLTVALPSSPAFTSFKFSVKEAGTVRPSGKYKAGFPTYVSGAMKDFDWPPANLDGVEPGNDNQCTIAAGMSLDKTYNGTFKSGTDADWQYVDIGAAKTLLITATNVPTPSQMQLFVVADGKCTSISNPPTAFVTDRSDPSVTLSGLSGGRVYIRLVAAMISGSAQRYSLRAAQNPTSGTFEDNDNPCQATPAMTDTTYTSYGDDNFDFFELNVPTTGTLSMTLGADVVTQLDLRSPVTDTNCSATTSTRALKQEFIVNNVAQIRYFVPPGKYYARMYIAPSNIPATPRTYTFRWTLTPGVKPAKVCVGQDDSIDDCGGDVVGNFMKLKWQGLNGNAKIRMEFQGNAGGGTGTCKAGSHAAIEFTTSALEGVQVLNSDGNWYLANGGYSVKIVATDASNPAVELYRNEQSLKVGCSFRPAGGVSLPALMP